jgi:aryl-alcohol dehydrogenase-like predicted oxidoreductase
MIRRKLGRSGIEVSILGLGCMEIGGAMKDDEQYHLTESVPGKAPVFYLGPVDDEQSIRTVRYAIDMGVNFFDTAPAYGAGHSERILGRAIAGNRHKVIIATKFGKLVDEQDNRFGRYPNARQLIDNIGKECEESLRRLGTDYIDLYQYHQMDYPLIEYAAEMIEILESLVSAGKIRWYGWSTENPVLARMFAQGAHYTAIQHNLNLIEDAPELLSICEEFDQASIARGILGMGFLTGKYTVDNYRSLLSPDDFRLREGSYFVTLIQKLEGLRGILTRDGRTLAQGALAWVWARSPRTIAIPGFRTLSQVENNIKAVDFGPLASAQMEEIDRLLERVA